MHLGNYMVKGWATAQGFAAVGTFIIPRQMDLIPRGFPRDQTRPINVVLVH